MGGWGGYDDDSDTQTQPTKSPQEPFYSVFTVLSRCPTFLYSCHPYFWTVRLKLCCLERKAEKTRNSLGEPFSSVFTVLVFATALLLGIYSTFAHNPEAFFGDDHDTVSRTPRTISPHPSAHTTQHFKRKPSYTEVGALGVLANSFHVQLASLFLMFIKCCASGFRSVKTFLAALAICTVFTTFSYYPTTCG